MDILRLVEPGKLDDLVGATTQLGAQVDCVICFIDGKPIFSTRPGVRAAASQGFNVSVLDIQRIFYNGHYKAHGVKIQYAVFTDGICVLECTSIRQHDQVMLTNSRLETALRLLWVEDKNGVRRHPCAYGDPAYTESDVVQRKAKGARDDAQKKLDKSMQSSRAGVEDMFCSLVKFFKFFNNKDNHRLLTRGRTGVAQALIAATILLNCHTIVDGVQANALYLQTPPTLEEYFMSANSDEYVDY